MVLLGLLRNSPLSSLKPTTKMFYLLPNLLLVELKHAADIRFKVSKHL